MNNSMEICAGTSQGVFVVSEGAAKQVLRSRDVRELVRIGGRCFAGTGDGLHVLFVTLFRSGFLGLFLIGRGSISHIVPPLSESRCGADWGRRPPW